jgi:hypothetical protein
LSGGKFSRRGRRQAANALVLAASLVLVAGCGAKSIVVGSVPFPAEKKVFRNEAGEETTGLSPSSRPVRLVFLDSPWCPQCAEVWNSLKSAASTFPPGTVHVYRILFDRERTYSPGGIRESSPLRPAPPPETVTDPVKAGRLEVTTLTALSRPFHKEFRVTQVPILLLLNENGRVEKRWTGYSPSLRDSLAEEVRRKTGSPLPAEK